MKKFITAILLCAFCTTFVYGGEFNFQKQSMTPKVFEAYSSSELILGDITGRGLDEAQRAIEQNQDALASDNAFVAGMALIVVVAALASKSKKNEK